MSTLLFNTTDYLVESFDDDFVMLNTRSGHYFDVVGGAAALLGELLRGADVEALVTAVDTRNPERAAKVREMLGTVVTISAFHPEAAPGLSPLQTAVTAIAESPDFICDGFDDLSALILADPVHDAPVSS